METVTLGRTGLEVSQLALGGLFVSAAGAETDEGIRAIKRAVELGVNYVDTAPGYANSEEVVGKALAEIDAPVVSSTKLGGRPHTFDPRDKACLRQSVEESLKLLGRDCIDILMIHEPDRPGQYDWWTDMTRVEGPVLEVLDELKAEGLIKYTGLGGTTAYELAHLVRSGKFDVVLTAFQYSALWREAENEIFPAAREVNAGVICGSPLQQGALAQKFEAVYDENVYWLSNPRREQLKAYYALADELDMPLPEIGIRFVISNRDVSCVLMGPRSVGEVEQNIRALDKGPLPEDVLARIDEIAGEVAFRPFEEPFGLGGALASPGAYKGPGHANR